MYVSVLAQGLLAGGAVGGGRDYRAADGDSDACAVECAARGTAHRVYLEPAADWAGGADVP